MMDDFDWTYYDEDEPLPSREETYDDYLVRIGDNGFVEPTFETGPLTDFGSRCHKPFNLASLLVERIEL